MAIFTLTDGLGCCCWGPPPGKFCGEEDLELGVGWRREGEGEAWRWWGESLGMGEAIPPDGGGVIPGGCPDDICWGFWKFNEMFSSTWSRLTTFWYWNYKIKNAFIFISSVGINRSSSSRNSSFAWINATWRPCKHTTYILNIKHIHANKHHTNIAHTSSFFLLGILFVSFILARFRGKEQLRQQIYTL